MLRQLFADSLEQQRQKYGEFDLHTAQAARDLGLFLGREGEAMAALTALSEAVHIDEQIAGPAAAQTLADVESLALVSPPEEAEPLWKRVAASADATVAAHAFAALGQLREKGGDLSGAAHLYRKALASEEKSAGRDSPRAAFG